MPKQKQRPTKSPSKSRMPVTKPKRFHERVFESDGTYFLKLVIVVILGTVWIKLQDPISWQGIAVGAVPVGVFVGLLFVRYFEKHQTDRKIWYAVLLITGVISCFFATGAVI